MEKIYERFVGVWQMLEGKLSFIKPQPLRIAVMVLAIVVALNILSSLIPITFAIIAVIFGVIVLFAMFDEREDDEGAGDPD